MLTCVDVIWSLSLLYRSPCRDWLPYNILLFSILTDGRNQKTRGNLWIHDSLWLTSVLKLTACTSFSLHVPWLSRRVWVEQFHRTMCLQMLCKVSDVETGNTQLLLRCFKISSWQCWLSEQRRGIDFRCVTLMSWFCILQYFRSWCWNRNNSICWRKMVLASHLQLKQHCGMVGQDSGWMDCWVCQPQIGDYSPAALIDEVLATASNKGFINKSIHVIITAPCQWRPAHFIINTQRCVL